MGKQFKSENKKGVERRVQNFEDTELRVSGGTAPVITGYAAKFGKWSEDLGGFREKIRVGAFDAVLEDDVRALKNHDANLLLGRTMSGTLRLTANTVGLRFEVDPPDTNVGRDTVEEIRRKDITGCSFGFIVETDKWAYLEDDTVERTIIKFKRLFDVGPVTYPAYPDTSVAARSLATFKASAVPTRSKGPAVVSQEDRERFARLARLMARQKNQLLSSKLQKKRRDILSKIR